MKIEELEKICKESWHGFAGIFEWPFVYVGITQEAWQEEFEYRQKHFGDPDYQPLWVQRGEKHELFILDEE